MQQAVMNVRVLALVIALALLPSRGWSQSATTGAVAGVVKDTTGAVLPGVTVEAASPALIEKVRTAVTDDQGNYKDGNASQPIFGAIASYLAPNDPPGPSMLK